MTSVSSIVAMALASIHVSERSLSSVITFTYKYIKYSSVGATATPAELRERLIEKLRLVLASGSDEECSVCLDSVRLPVITHCAHVYCRPCIAQVIGTEQVLPSASFHD